MLETIQPRLKALDGTTAVYESFKHSQGSATIQADLLGIIDQRYGIAPDFTLDEAAMSRYMRFLAASNTTGSKSHVSMPAKENVIKRTVAHTNDAYKGSQAVSKHLAPEERLGRLTVSIAELETERFGDSLWYARRRHIRLDRLYRLQTRLKDGKLSFLHFYGGCGDSPSHSTGYVELDEIYGDMADFYDKNSADEIIASHREQLVAAPGRIVLACRREGLLPGD